MKAIRSYQPTGADGIDDLVYEDAPDPQPAVGDALVEVRAAGLTPTELLWPLRTDRAGHDRNPTIPAHEFSGVVTALGWGTAVVAVGDEVIGLIDGYRDGGAAEYVAIDARDLAPKPATLDWVQAAALPQAGVTSWQALYVHGRLTAGQTVVVHGAAGGVGSVAVQLAHASGARVVGTGRANAEAQVRKLGADEFLDLTSEAWEAALGEADLVFDTIGGNVLAATAAALRPGAALVTITTPVPTDRDDIRTQFFIRDPSGAQLAEVSRLADAGKVHPQVGAVYPLSEAREAFGAKAAGVTGKVIVRPGA